MNPCCMLTCALWLLFPVLHGGAAGKRQYLFSWELGSKFKAEDYSSLGPEFPDSAPSPGSYRSTHALSFVVSPLTCALRLELCREGRRCDCSLGDVTQSHTAVCPCLSQVIAPFREKVSVFELNDNSDTIEKCPKVQDRCDFFLFLEKITHVLGSFQSIPSALYLKKTKHEQTLLLGRTLKSIL